MNHVTDSYRLMSDSERILRELINTELIELGSHHLGERATPGTQLHIEILCKEKHRGHLSFFVNRTIARTEDESSEKASLLLFSTMTRAQNRNGVTIIMIRAVFLSRCKR